MKVAAIVLAAGKGKRIKSKIHKPYINLHGKPIIIHTLLRLSANRHITEIIVAVSKKKRYKARREIINRFRIKKVRIVSGGKERRDSVFNALKNVSKDVDYVLIHDCVRPFVTDRLIERSLKAAQRFSASVAAVPVKPTLKYVGKNKRIFSTVDRKNLWEAQTPQVFKRTLVERAYRKLDRKKLNVTDDSMVVELLGVRPMVVLGSYNNIKITTREDLELARILCRDSEHKGSLCG